MADAAEKDGLKARIEASNLDPETYLATDYLNHFNEIAMLLEMVPDMPEIMEDVRAWAPKSYQDHFRDSTIADREIAIEAYDHVKMCYREPFEQTVQQLNAFVPNAIVMLDSCVERGDPDLLRERVRMASQMFQRLLDTASGIIHGGTTTMDQNEIDSILG